LELGCLRILEDAIARTKLSLTKLSEKELTEYAELWVKRLKERRKEILGKREEKE
jgi:hypothetical protein